MDHELLFDQDEGQLSLEIGVRLDERFPKVRFRHRALELANRYDAQFILIECICSKWTWLRQRLTNREQCVPHWTPVGGEELEKMRAYFGPWLPDSALRLDAGSEFDSECRAPWNESSEMTRHANPSLELTPPRCDLMIGVDQRRRSARDRWAARP
jgi:hypothetical protein